MEKISDHITYLEAIGSNNAMKHGLDNTPNEEQLKNMRALGESVFEPLRRLSGGLRINIEAFHRSGVLQRSALTGKMTSVNKLAGGATKSQHLTLGYNAAIDIDNDKYPDRTPNDKLFVTAYNNMEVNYDQIIAENIDDNGHVGWVHASHKRDSKQRRQALIMLFYYESEEDKKNKKKKRSYQIYNIAKGLIRSRYLLPGWL